MRPPGTPNSTYRLQIRQQFNLSAAGELADYLRSLGADAIAGEAMTRAAATAPTIWRLSFT